MRYSWSRTPKPCCRMVCILILQTYLITAQACINAKNHKNADLMLLLISGSTVRVRADVQQNALFWAISKPRKSRIYGALLCVNTSNASKLFWDGLGWSGWFWGGLGRANSYSFRTVNSTFSGSSRSTGFPFQTTELSLTDYRRNSSHSFSRLGSAVQDSQYMRRQIFGRRISGFRLEATNADPYDTEVYPMSC